MSGPLIVFSGVWLDAELGDIPATQTRPIGIRAYDQAGNELMRAPIGERMTDYIITDVIDGPSGETRYFMYDGYTNYGTPVTLYSRAFSIASGNQNSMPWSFRPVRTAVDSHGRVFATGCNIRTNATTWSAPAVMEDDYDTLPFGGSSRRVMPFTLHTGEWIRVYRRDGDHIDDFPQLHGAEIRAIVIDDDDNIYVGGFVNLADHVYLRKYDLTGTLIWSVTAPPAFYSGYQSLYYLDIVEEIELDGAGGCYIKGHTRIYATPVNGGSFFAHVDNTGTITWRWEAQDSRFAWREITDYVITTDGRLFTASLYQLPVDHEYAFSHVQERVLTTGEVLRHGYLQTADDATEDQIVRARLREYAGALHFFPSRGVLGFDHYTLSKSDLSILSEARLALNHETSRPYPESRQSGFDARDTIAIDEDGTVYCGCFENPCGTATGLRFRARYLGQDMAGSGCVEAAMPWYAVDTDWAHIADDGQVRHHITIAYGTPIPPVSVGVWPRLPTIIGDQNVHSPPGALRFALSGPVLRRQYSGALRLPDVYRLLLEPDVWVPLASVSIQRTADGATLTAISPAATGPLITAALARAEADADAVLYRGVRFADGTEQLEEMLRGPTKSVRSDRGGRSGSITLTAAVSVPDIVATTTRALSGISYINRTNGKTRIRCAVDTYLQPGDTLILPDGTSLLVDSLTYTISPVQGVMEVSDG